MRWLMLALFVAVASASYGQERCYTSEVDWTATITDDGTNNGPLVKRSPGKTTVMSTMGAGTGLQIRIAIEEDGTRHYYRYVGDVLIMDMTGYFLGCPGGISWIDQTCSKVLISQVDAYAEIASFYLAERDHFITNCRLSAPFKERAVIDLQCSSGKTLHVDASDYPSLLVDGAKMLPYGGPLPCRDPRKTSP